MNQQLALTIQLNDEANLTNFCWGDNALLEKELLNSLNTFDAAFFYIWGDTGRGKSHLLQACCNYLSHKTSIYLPLKILKDFSPKCIENIGEPDLIAIDDIDAIVEDKAWEEALFHLYNRIRDSHNSLLVISSQQPLASLSLKLPDLKSRLSSGLTAELLELNDEFKIKTIEAHAKSRGFILPTTVSEFLIKRTTRGMHELYHLVDRLDKESLAAQRKITIPFVKEIFKF